mmetsp:Transcript_26645/g.62583  ORF Transcript_26645/g.62583 Transcript_26645/m.62583 type:complete len:272 (+) Transcript_26645:497-1312(+)
MLPATRLVGMLASYRWHGGDGRRGRRRRRFVRRSGLGSIGIDAGREAGFHRITTSGGRFRRGDASGGRVRRESHRNRRPDRGGHRRVSHLRERVRQRRHRGGLRLEAQGHGSGRQGHGSGRREALGFLLDHGPQQGLLVLDQAPDDLIEARLELGVLRPRRLVDGRLGGELARVERAVGRLCLAASGDRFGFRFRAIGGWLRWTASLWNHRTGSPHRRGRRMVSVPVDFFGPGGDVHYRFLFVLLCGTVQHTEAVVGIGCVALLGAGATAP